VPTEPLAAFASLPPAQQHAMRDALIAAYLRQIDALIAEGKAHVAASTPPSLRPAKAARSAV
jgi:hypothetical protein